MKIERFEDIESWKVARDVVRDVYQIMKPCKDFGFKDQIQRASISIMSNIAEGFDRGSNKEFIHFLTIARGSAAEVKSLSYSGMDIGYLNEYECVSLQGKCTKLSGLINGFIRYLKNSSRKS